MKYSSIFLILIIVLSVWLVIATHQKKRIIVASSGLYALVIYYALFDIIKDQSTLTLLVKIRPDLIFDSLRPVIYNVFSFRFIRENPLLLKIITYRPSTSTSIFGDLSLKSLYNYFVEFLDSIFENTSVQSFYKRIFRYVEELLFWIYFDGYLEKIRKIALALVIVMCEVFFKQKYVLNKEAFKKFNTQMAI